MIEKQRMKLLSLRRNRSKRKSRRTIWLKRICPSSENTAISRKMFRRKATKGKVATRMCVQLINFQNYCREQFTLQLLKNFKSKLANIRSEVPEASTSEATKKAVVDDEEDLNSDTWLTHTLRFEEQGEVLAKDASTKKDDWYSNDVNDPRNPINKRKRGEEDRRRDRDRTSRTSNSNSSSSRHRR